jgi:GTPase SAR1 family protein
LLGSDPAVGKTSLLKALVGSDDVCAQVPETTDGIDMVDWKCGNVELSCLDFAGQETYYTTHQLFLSASAVYVLVWHPRLHVDQQTHFWLKSIDSRAEGVPVLVVASHHDAGHNVGSSLSEEALRSRYPSLRLQFASVSSSSGHGIVELRKLLVDAALSLPHTRKVI